MNKILLNIDLLMMAFIVIANILFAFGKMNLALVVIGFVFMFSAFGIKNSWSA